MTDISIEDFFIEANSVTSIKEENYRELDLVLRAVDSFSRSTYQSVYVIDYFKKGFLYVSDNPLFLCGYTPQEMLELGYSFYISNVPKEEQVMLKEINKSGFNFFNSFPVRERRRCIISYDFHILYGRHSTLINHKITPLVMTEDGRMWLGLCVVSLSSHSSAGHIEFRIYGDNRIWDYSQLSHKWKERGEIVLTPEEKEVLVLSAQGLNRDEIANHMCKSVDSIKFYRRNLFDKLGVKNITEALSYVTNHGLL